jgi:hypothetical protein
MQAYGSIHAAPVRSVNSTSQPAVVGSSSGTLLHAVSGEFLPSAVLQIRVSSKCGWSASLEIFTCLLGSRCDEIWVVPGFEQSQFCDGLLSVLFEASLDLAQLCWRKGDFRKSRSSTLHIGAQTSSLPQAKAPLLKMRTPVRHFASHRKSLRINELKSSMDFSTINVR